ncbi:hypothetical protein MOUN0_M02542 [Monosporozyma unispora]
MQRGILKVNFNLPDGTTHNTIGSNLYGFPDQPLDDCSVVSMSYSFTTVMTTTITTTSTTVTDTLSGPIAISTSTTISWKNDDNGNVKIVYVVEKPVPATTVLSTTASTITRGTVPVTTTTIAIGSTFTVQTIVIVITLHSITPLTSNTTVTTSIPALTTTTTTTTTTITGTDGF